MRALGYVALLVIMGALLHRPAEGPASFRERFCALERPPLYLAVGGCRDD